MLVTGSVNTVTQCLKEKTMKRVFALSLFLTLMLVSFGVSGEGQDENRVSYVGTWLRVEKYANDVFIQVDERATLVLTDNTFSADSKGVPTATCSNSGTLSVHGEMMTMTVKASTCPSIITVGSVITYTYSLSPDKKRLTMTNKEWGYTYREVLRRM